MSRGLAACCVRGECGQQSLNFPSRTRAAKNQGACPVPRALLTAVVPPGFSAPVRAGGGRGGLATCPGPARGGSLPPQLAATTGPGRSWLTLGRQHPFLPVTMFGGNQHIHQ